MSPPEPYYHESGVTIYCGDCASILPHLDPVQVILTDPPYGIRADRGGMGIGGKSDFGSARKKDKIKIRTYADTWDKGRPDAWIFAAMLDLADVVLCFGGNYFADQLPPTTHWLVWDKLQTMPTFSDCELIWTNVKRKSVKKKTFEWNGLIGKEAERWHPTQKPLELIKDLLTEYSQPGDVILDPFMGSGTTLRAAKDLGRHAIGIEIEEKYCQVAVERLRQEVLNF